MSENATEPAAGISPIRLVGAEPTVLSADELESLPLETKEIEVICASSTRYTAVWRGIPVGELLETIEVPSETTHVVIESDDGHRSCVDISAALAGLIAFYRDGKPLSEYANYGSRFVVPSVDGARMTKSVQEIRAIRLPPESSPDSNEIIGNDPSFGSDR